MRIHCEYVYICIFYMCERIYEMCIYVHTYTHEYVVCVFLHCWASACANNMFPRMLCTYVPAYMRVYECLSVFSLAGMSTLQYISTWSRYLVSDVCMHVHESAHIHA
jgi:hypothetical protein